MVRGTFISQDDLSPCAHQDRLHMRRGVDQRQMGMVGWRLRPRPEDFLCASICWGRRNEIHDAQRHEGGLHLFFTWVKNGFKFWRWGISKAQEGYKTSR